MKHLTIIIILLACLPLFSTSQTIFNGSVDANWNNPENWSEGLPAAGGTAVIAPGVFAEATNLNIDFNLINQGQITLGGVSLKLNELVSNSGALRITASLVEFNSVFLNSGIVRLSGIIDINNGALVDNQPNGTLATQPESTVRINGGYVYNKGSLVNYGLIQSWPGGYTENKIGGVIYNIGGFGYYAEQVYEVIQSNTADGGWVLDYSLNDIGNYRNKGVIHNSGTFSTLGQIDNSGTFYNCDGNLNLGAWNSEGITYTTCPTCVLGNAIVETACPTYALGCTASTACNYEPNAVENGSCDYDSCQGCTDSAACNYEPEASIDDGSCADIGPCGQCGGNGTPGCNDPTACNFNPEADCSDDSCTYEGCLPGCTNESACNYSPNAVVDNGSCVLPGCNDASSCNYDPNASCFDEDSCLPVGHCDCPTSDVVEGCRMPSACNYDSAANSGDADLCHWNCYSTCSDASSCNFQEPITTGSAQLQCLLAGAIWDTQLLSCNYEPTEQECNEAWGYWHNESCMLMMSPWDPNGPVGIIQAEAAASGVVPPSSWDYPAEMYWEQVIPFGYCNDQGYYGSCLCANEAAANPYYSSFEMQTCSDGSASWTGHGTGSNTVTINYPCTPTGYYDGGTGSNNITIYIPSGVEQFHLHNSTGSNVYNVFYNSSTTTFTHHFSTGSPTLNLNGDYVSEPFCSGCMTEDACNYQAIATTQAEGSCDFASCAGCLDETACNYDPNATYAGYCIENGTDVQFDFMGFGSGEISISAGDFVLSHDAASFTTCLEPNTLYTFTTESNGWSEQTYSISGVQMVQGTSTGSMGSTGSFIVVSPGECNDCSACNYSSGSNSADGCDYTTCNVIGCTDPTSCNFLPEAIYDDGNCIDEGLCYDSEACNYFHVNDSTPACREFMVKLVMSSNDGPIAFALRDGTGEIVEDLNGNSVQDSFCGNSYIQSNGYIACSGASSYIQGNNPTFHACLTEGECYVVEMYAEQDSLCSDGGCTNPSSYDAWGLSTHSSGGPHVQITDAENTEAEVQNFTFYEGLFGTEDLCIAQYSYDNGCNNADFFCTYPGCTDPEACNFDDTAGCDDESCTYDCIWGCTDSGACNFLDTANADDGTCYLPDVCGVCDGPGNVYDCGCSELPNGDCDCEGNQLDALGICGGACASDIDLDGVCDDVDDCIGEHDECGVCNGAGAIYDCGCTEVPVGNCDCDGNQLDAIGVCGGDCLFDTDADGICDNIDTCMGSVDACGICNGPGAIYDCGCSDSPIGDCDCDGNQLDALGVCGGDCDADADTDGICDDVDDCVGEVDACGICMGDGVTCLGCTYNTAMNYDSSATIDDGSCTFHLSDSCAGDFNGDDYIGIDDILSMLSLYDTSCSE